MSGAAQIDWIIHLRDRDIIAQYAAGHSLRVIGRAFGLSHVGVMKILARHGVERRPAINPAPGRQAAASAALAAAIRLHHGERAA